MLFAMFAPQLPPHARMWLDEVLPTEDPEILLRAFRSASRFDQECFVAPAYFRERFAAVGLSWVAQQLDLTSAVRLLLVVHLGRTSDDADAVVRVWYQGADTGGRRAILRALPLLPCPKRHVGLALLGAFDRAAVFEAIALDNPFPAHHFGDRDLERLALRARAEGHPAARLLGIEQRLAARTVTATEASSGH